MHTAVAVAASLIALAFAFSTFERWLARGRKHELAWSVALAMFALASASLAAGAQLGWNGVTFRLFYVFGAVANVPILALGTVYLLAKERTGDRVAAAVALLVALGAGVVLASPFTHPLPPHELVQGSKVFGPAPRVFAAVGSGLGALVIIGGALWSAIRFRRGRLLWSNVLIATGTLVLSGSGLLNSVLDEMNAFAVTLVVGITVIFCGFLVAAAGSSRPAATSATKQGTLRAVS